MCRIQSRGPSGRTVLLVAVWLVASLSPAAGAIGPTHRDTVPIADVVTDRDGDRVPDRLGDTVTVVGRATVASGVLFEDRLVVYVQDSTAGIRLYSPALADPVRRGDRVRATGTVDHYRGQSQIAVHDYRVRPVGSGPPPPAELRYPTGVALESREGQLVRVTGEIVGRGANVGGQYLELLPPGGDRQIEVFSADWRQRPLDLGAFGFGGRVEVVGVAGQYDSTAPYTSGYQIYPRTNDDLQRAPVLLGLDRSELTWAGGGLLLLLLGTGGGWVFRLRRKSERSAERYERLFEQNQAGVFRTTVSGEILDGNAALAEMYGFDSPEEMRGARAWDLYRDLSDREQYLRDLREQGEVEDYLLRCRTRDGERRWMLCNARLVGEEDGEEREVVGTVIDLTERVRAERQQEAAEERYRALFEENVAGAFLARPDGTLLEVNPATAEMLGFDSPAELEGRDVREVCERPRRQEELARKLDREGSLKNEEIALQRRDGESVWVLVNSFVVDDPETGDPLNIGTMTEITEHVEEERELEELANHDPLTGLPNRRFLEESVPRMLARAEREDEPVGVVYLDLNDFKEVNDERGHAAGDAVLEVVADRLEESARDADLVGRVGGDEFVLVLPGLDAREDALRAAYRQASAAFEQPLEVEDETFSITAKLGVAVCPDDGTDFDDLLEKADRAMYRAADGEGPVAGWEAPNDAAEAG